MVRGGFTGRKEIELKFRTSGVDIDGDFLHYLRKTETNNHLVPANPLF